MDSRSHTYQADVPPYPLSLPSSPCLLDDSHSDAGGMDLITFTCWLKLLNMFHAFVLLKDLCLIGLHIPCAMVLA